LQPWPLGIPGRVSILSTMFTDALNYFFSHNHTVHTVLYIVSKTVCDVAKVLVFIRGGHPLHFFLSLLITNLLAVLISPLVCS
jgi:hypothetical protein